MVSCCRKKHEAEEKQIKKGKKKGAKNKKAKCKYNTKSPEFEG